MKVRIVYQSLFLLFVYISFCYSGVIHIPDPNLEEVIREKLALIVGVHRNSTIHFLAGANMVFKPKKYRLNREENYNAKVDNCYCYVVFYLCR